MDCIRVLLDEHTRIRKMLQSFEQQLDQFERAESVEFDTLAGAIDYCRLYLDQWHHPREDALFAKLEMRNPSAAQACNTLEHQHTDLGKSTRTLAQAFEAVRFDVPHSRDKLVALGRRLCSSYREHLAWEERHFFPLLERTLTPEDWDAVKGNFTCCLDPLTAAPIDSRYLALLNAMDGLVSNEPHEMMGA